MFRSITAMQAELARLRAADDRGAAVRALIEQHLDAFPLHVGFTYQMLAELQAEAGERERALDTLARALAKGARYRAEWLTGDARLASVREEPRFTALVRQASAVYDDAAAAAKPHLTFAMPDTLPDAFGYPLLMVLHGNGSNAKETAPYWTSMADKGWVVAVPQSSEVGASRDAYTWNDRERTAKELDLHFDRVKRATEIDTSRIVLAGFSMGATHAIAFALTKRFTIRGFIAVAAWLPHVREFRGLIEGGAAKMLRAYITVGSDDPSCAGARELAEVMTEHKFRTKVDERPGLGHSYPDDMDATVETALAFATK